MNSSRQSGTVNIGSALDTFMEKIGLPGIALKVFAEISMLVDHTGASVIRALQRHPYVVSDPKLAMQLSHLYSLMRKFGRLAFPIFCFLLVEGFLHTKNVKRYASRLFIYALISEFPFDYCLHHGEPFLRKQNVYFTLLIGLLVLWGVRELRGYLPAQLLLMVAGMMLARWMRTDYQYHGVFAIEMLYILHFQRELQCMGGAAYFLQYEKMPTPLAFIPALLYNGKRGRQHKHFHYWFYPAHLMILGLISHRLIPWLK